MTLANSLNEQPPSSHPHLQAWGKDPSRPESRGSWGVQTTVRASRRVGQLQR